MAARPQYTPEQRNFLAMAFERHKTTKYRKIQLVQQEFTQKFPEARLPGKTTIHYIWKKQNKFFTYHNLNSKQSAGDTFSGRSRSARTPENIEAVKALLDADAKKEADDPNINTCRKNELGITPSAFCRIVKELKYHCYKMDVSQKLNEGDNERRLQFANFVLNNLTDADLNNCAFSDEATFSLDGEVNTQNIRRYAEKKVHREDQGGKPAQFRHTKSKYPQKVMVFMGLHSSGKTWGLKFYQNKNINGDEYYKLLRFKCVPRLKQINDGSLNGMWFQQDGATVHRTGRVLRYLDRQFGQRMMAMSSIQGHDWPARSPDLNPLDFFAWGYLKSRVFRPRPATMPQLIARIELEVKNLNSDMIKRACLDIKTRCQRVIASSGGFIE